MKLRKFIHMLFGLVALTLRWLDWRVALLLATLAFLHNLFLFPRYLSSVFREKYDKGILAYPLAVGLLILLLRDSLHVVAAAWAVMAFGDGAASFVGGRKPLPWNRKKSWEGMLAFFLTGFPAGLICLWFVGERYGMEWGAGTGVFTVALLVALIVESLDLNAEDNITVPFSFAYTFLIASRFHPFPAPEKAQFIAALVSFALALLAYLLGQLTFPAASGAGLLGAGVSLMAGVKAFLVLLLFYAISTGAGLVLGRGRGERRGLASVASKGLPALIFSYLYACSLSTLYLLALSVSLAWSAFDTIASEVGTGRASRAYEVPSFRKVPPGTRGAVSLTGLAAGAAGYLVIAFAARLLFSFSVAWLALGFLSVLFFSFIESLLNRVCPSKHLPNFLCSYGAGELVLFLKV